MALGIDRAVVRELFETIILALLIFMVMQGSIRNYRVEGPSMMPTLEEGQFVLVNKLVYFHFDPRDLIDFIPFVDVAEGAFDESVVFPFHPPQKGEVIIFRFPQDPTRDFVKRVIAAEGDTVRILNGQVFVNGVAIEEPYLTATDRSDYPETVIPQDSYFVLGDNRRSSSDSRNWGPISNTHIIGRAWVAFWPLDRWNLLSVAQ